METSEALNKIDIPLKGTVIYEDSTMASRLSLTESGDNYQAGRKGHEQFFRFQGRQGCV